MAEEKQEIKQFTKKELEAFLSDIACQVVEGGAPPIHSIIALDRILRQPNSHEILDDGLKSQARDLWVKVKSSGFELEDPPILFGAPSVEQ